MKQVKAIVLLTYNVIISDKPLSGPDVSQPTQSNNTVDTKDIVLHSTMAEISEVNGSPGVEDVNDLKPSFTVC